MTYTKDQLTFPYLQVWYKYKAANQSLDAWKDKRMTGFRLSWRIGNPTLYLSTTESDCVVETPNDSMSNQTYNATLHIPTEFAGKMGDENLVVELDWDTSSL